MKLGLIGFPASGKTTVFNAITGSSQPVGTYLGLPSIHTGQVHMADTRLEWLRDIYKPKKYTPAQYDCLDITGLVTGTATRQEIDAKVLNEVKQCDALVFVLRAFVSADVPHPKGKIDPDSDYDDAALEMLFADIAVIDNRVERLEKQLTRFNREEDKTELVLMKRIKAHVDAEKPMREMELNKEELKAIRGFQLLTLKPWMKIYDVGESMLAGALPNPEWNNPDKRSLAFCGKLEMEIAQMAPADREVFLKELGISEPVSARLARMAYHMLGLRSFFTVGSDEVRAWTISEGDTALTAAGTIHTDLARGFIRAETVSYDDLRKYGDMKAVKAAGKFRLEGKEYVVKDGDILNIRFNV
jgi:ribosome-binding ATPase